jgi:hypothetical protein
MSFPYVTVSQKNFPKKCLFFFQLKAFIKEEKAPLDIELAKLVETRIALRKRTQVYNNAVDCHEALVKKKVKLSSSSSLFTAFQCQPLQLRVGAQVMALSKVEPTNCQRQ